MRAHGSRSQQEPVANGDLNIDNIINANIGGSGARHGNDLSLRSRLGEDRVFLYPFLFRLDFGLSEKLHGVLVQPSSLYVSSHYRWVP